MVRVGHRTREGTDYNCHDVARRAQLFDDTTRCQQIIASSDSAEQKALERAMSGFDSQTRNGECLCTARRANLCKSSRNPNLRRLLSGTGNRVLAESSQPSRLYLGSSFQGRRPTGLSILALGGKRPSRARADGCSAGAYLSLSHPHPPFQTPRANYY